MAAQRRLSARNVVARVSAVPVLVRVGIFFSMLVSLALAYPAELLTGRPLLALTGVALLPAFGPRRIWPTLAMLVAVGGWLFASAGYGRPIALWRLLALAALLYLTHVLCGLAALLPLDAVVDPEVIMRWLGRAGAVVLATAVLGVLLIELGDRSGGQGYLIVAVGGLGVAVATATLLGWLLRRR